MSSQLNGHTMPTTDKGTDVAVQHTTATNNMASQHHISMSYEKVQESANYMLQNTKHRPKIAIICGSGLSGVGDLIEDCKTFPYNEIPNFPITTAPGHKSRLLFGTLNGVTVMLMQGRFHLYEGYSIQTCAMPVRVMRLIGVETLIVTNAAGGLNNNFKNGDIMVLKDHINFQGFAGTNPVSGPNDDRFGPRFFSLNPAYDIRWRKLAKKVASSMGIRENLHEGVYTMLGGPNFETPSELQMMKLLGVDAVGMSTVHEVITARHCGLDVFAFSLITNACAVNHEDEPTQVDLAEEVFDVAAQSQDTLKEFVSNMVKQMSQQMAPVEQINGTA